VVPTQHNVGILLYVVHNSGFFCLTERLSVVGFYWLTLRNLLKLLGQFSDLAVPPTCKSQQYIAHTVKWQLVICTILDRKQ